MPATCPALIHPSSLLLLVGAHLLVGSAVPFASFSPPPPPPPAASSFSAEPERSSLSAPGPLPREEEVPPPPPPPAAASAGGARPAPGGPPTRRSNAAMTNSQNEDESSQDETKFSSPYVLNTDTSSSLGSDDGRTLWAIANTAPVSMALTESSASYAKRIRSGHLAHYSSSLRRTRKVYDTASASTVGAAAVETVTLSISSPKIPVASLSEINHSATEDSYHLGKSWNAGSTTSDWYSESMDSSAKMDREAERSSLFLTESVPLTDSTRKNAFSARQIITSFGQAQLLSHGIHSRKISSTSDITQLPDSSVETSLTHSYFSRKTTAEDSPLPGSSSVTDRTVSGSSMESTERTLQALRDINTSYKAAQISTASSDKVSSSDSHSTTKMDLSLGNTDLDEEMVSHFQTDSEKIAVEDNNQPRSTFHIDRSVSSLHVDSGSISSLSGRDGERTSQTLRSGGAYHSTTEMSTTINTNSSITVRLTDFSSKLTPVQTTQMDLLAGDSVNTEAAILHSQTPKATAVENNGLLKNSSNREKSVSTSHRKNVPTSGLSSRSEEMLLQTLEDMSNSYNATQISPVSSNELSSNLDFTDSSHALIPVQTSQMDLSGNGNARNNDPSAKTAAEDSDLLRWNTNTNQVVSSSEAENTSVSGISERVRERTLRTLRDVSSSLHALQRAATSSNEVFSSFGLTNSFSDIAAVETGQTDLPPGNTDVRNITPSEVTAVEDSSQLSSSSDRSSMTSGSASDLSDRGEERTLQMLRDISTSHKATQVSVVSGKEISSSSDFTNFTSVLTPVQAGQTDLSPELTVHIEGTVTESQPASETTAVEDRSLLKWSSHREKDVYSPESESVSVPGLFDKDRTLQTLNDISSFRNVAQKNPISSHETFSSLALTESSLLTLVQTEQVGDVEFTEATHVHSQPQSGITDVNGNQDFSTEKRDTQTESMFSVVPLVRSGAGTLSSLPNRNKSIDLMELSTSEDVSSSLSTQTFFSTAENGKEISPSTGIDITESLKDTLLTYSSKTSIYSPSALDLSNPGSSPQIDRLDAEGRLSSAATDSVYQSTVFTNGGVRTLRSLPDNSTSAVVIDSSTYESENSSSSEQTLPLMSVTEMEKHNVSLSEMQSTGPSTEHLFEYSSLIPMDSSSPKDSSTAGSSHHSSRSPSIPHSYTESTYTLSSFSYGDSVIKTIFTKATENPSLNMEKINSSEVNPFSPEVYSGQTDLSLNNLYVSSTETLQKLSSSRTPSYFFPSESSDTGTGYHPINSTDTEKKTSVSHTDSTYTSTIFTKGGERTLLSVLNSSTSLDSSESSTFHAEISNPSEMTQSASYENESITSSLSDMDFSGPSTETLAVHSQKTSEYSSTVSKSHTTPFSSKSESTFSNSFSFTSSLPTSLKQDSYPPTQPSTLFLLPETSFPPTLSSPPQTSPVTFSHRLPSAAAPPSSSVSSSSLQTSVSSSSSSSQLSGSLETSISVGAPEGTTGRDPHTTVRPYSEHNHQTKMYVLKDSTFLMSTGPSPLLTETTEQLTSYSSPITISLEESKTSKGQNVSLLGSNSEKSIPILATSPMYFPESTMVSETTKATTPTLLSTNTLKDIFSLVETTTRKKRNETTYTTLRMPTLVAGGDILVSMKPHKDTSSSTKTTQSTGMPTRGTEKTSTTTTVVQKHIMTTTQPAIMVSSGKTSKEALSVSPVSTKTTTVIWFGSTKTFSASPGKDVDECLHNPCPSLASCVNTQGSFYCTCSLGYWMEKGKCSLVRTFIGQFPLLFNTTGGKYSEPHHIEEGIINLLNDSLSTLPGYYTSAVKTSRHLDAIQVSVLSTFSLVSNVTLYDIVSAVRNHIRACKAPTETCHFISNLTMLHRVGGLCKLKDPGCDKETSMCVDFDGVAVCRCRPGYFKYNKLDLSCRACDDGYKLENDTCVSCPFGLGGFNCGNPYQLITIVIAAAGGGLLLIMGIALIVTCCQKNKNDISKLIFKSGDFQMSPYAEYPKNPRAQDWGRETIEMQENGSTKNLLQMTDVYYMPTNLRNPELERNGIYPPYTGLPGSRHSCIYPGQYNPSFISDDSRRRDYF